MNTKALRKLSYGLYVVTSRSGERQSDPPGTPFEQLPEGWVCPVCGLQRANSRKFRSLGREETCSTSRDQRPSRTS